MWKSVINQNCLIYKQVNTIKLTYKFIYFQDTTVFVQLDSNQQASEDLFS